MNVQIPHSVHFPQQDNDRKADYIHCSRFNQRRVESYQFDAATSATGYTSEDYSDAARQLSGQAYGGAGKSAEPYI